MLAREGLPLTTFMNWSTDLEARELPLKRVAGSAGEGDRETASTLSIRGGRGLTGVVDLSEGEDIQERENAAMGQVEPHQSMGHRVSVHRHDLLQGCQHSTPLRLGGRERGSSIMHPPQTTPTDTPSYRPRC